MNSKITSIHQFEKLAYGMGTFCIYFLVFVHKYIIHFVACVYNVDNVQPGKYQELKIDLKYLYYLLRYVVF